MVSRPWLTDARAVELVGNTDAGREPAAADGDLAR